jgi:hypothetical protein
MSYKCFVPIKEVVGNYLTSFTTKGAYYLAIIKPNIIDLGPSLLAGLIVINI